ncbi:MAG: hypothetical protein ABGY96_01390 [bacterium]
MKGVILICWYMVSYQRIIPWVIVSGLSLAGVGILINIGLSDYGLYLTRVGIGLAVFVPIFISPTCFRSYGPIVDLHYFPDFSAGRDWRYC